MDFKLVTVIATCLGAISSTVCAVVVVIQLPSMKSKLAKLLEQGKAEMDNKNYDKAAETFTMATKLAPSCSEAWAGRQEALYKEYGKN